MSLFCQLLNCLNWLWPRLTVLHQILPLKEDDSHWICYTTSHCYPFSPILPGMSFFNNTCFIFRKRKPLPSHYLKPGSPGYCTWLTCYNYTCTYIIRATLTNKGTNTLTTPVYWFEVSTGFENFYNVHVPQNLYFLECIFFVTVQNVSSLFLQQKGVTTTEWSPCLARLHVEPPEQNIFTLNMHHIHPLHMM